MEYTEIKCKKCGRVLAHVYYGEGEIQCKDCKSKPITKYKIICQDLTKIYSK